MTRTRVTRSLFYIAYVMECRVLYRMPEAFMRTMAGPRFEEIRNDPATWNMYRVFRGPCLKSLSQPAGMRNDWETMETGSFSDAREVRCPTLVIYDPLDPLVPECHAQWALSTIPGARECKLHAGGHLIWLGKDADRMRSERVALLREHAS